jgi:hypothetical protein
MEVLAKLELNLKNKELAEATFKSVSPDNISIPESLGLSMHLAGNVLTVELYTSSRPDTLISTVDDILRSCQIALESIRSVNE